MTTNPHANLTGTDLHEPKGVAAAAVDKVYVADGAGSGTWQKITGSQLNVTAADIPGAVKAYVNFTVSSGVVTIANAYNVSAVTRLGLSGYSITFTTNLPSANYSVAGAAGTGTILVSLQTPMYINGFQFNTTSNGTLVDPSICTLIVFGG